MGEVVSGYRGGEVLLFCIIEGEDWEPEGSMGKSDERAKRKQEAR